METSRKKERPKQGICMPIPEEKIINDALYYSAVIKKNYASIFSFKLILPTIPESRVHAQQPASFQ